MSARTRVGERCFERVVLCDQHCFWNWPPEGSWLEAVQPHSVAQQARMSLQTWANLLGPFQALVMGQSINVVH